MTDQEVSVRPPPSRSRAPRRPRGRPHNRPIGPADLLGPIGITTIVVAISMWYRTGGFLQLVNPGTSLGSIGLITGLVSSDLMILQVFLLSRAPWVERAWGHDVLTRRHRQLGYWSLWLMITHVVAFGLERMGRGPALTSLWAVFITDSWMLMATVGTLMLIGVVATSIQIARKRLRYESWHLIHLYAYLGMAFALPHQIFDGQHFHGLGNQIYWWGLYATAAVAILGYRVALPLWRSFRHGLRVSDVVTEAPGVVSVHVAGRDLQRLRTRSGQFFIWRFLDGPGWTRGNPYTLSAAPQPDQLRVTIQAVGDGSERAAALKPGTRVLIEGPYGTMTNQRRRHPKMLLVAGGVGITPMRALLEDGVYGPGEATLLYRYSSQSHVLFRNELDHLASTRGLDVIYLPGARGAKDSWLPSGTDADDTEFLKRLIPDMGERDVFVCGPPGWIGAVRKAARSAGARSEDVHSEDFTW